MEDVYFDEDCCEKADVREEQLDLSTEEGRLKYLQSLKDKYIARYKLKQTIKLKEGLREKACLQAIEELGITREEYDQTFGISKVSSYREHYVKLTDEEAKKIEAAVHEWQHLQEDIVCSLSDPDLCVKAAKEGTRNSLIDRYNLIEKLKCHYMDVLSSYYLKSEQAIAVVNCRGKQFTKEVE